MPTDATITFPLWPEPLPGVDLEETPALTVYRPEEGKSTGATFVVCPGGGYQNLAPHEGKPIARWLASLGITAAVLTYRLAPRHRHPAMLQDAQRAIRTVRALAVEWNADGSRLGIIGFSAGGHLAATTATHYDAGNPDSADPIERESSRPDLAVLVYPVISMVPPHVHEGSRDNLVGVNPAPDLLEALSNERQVTPDTPPCFLLHSADDDVVMVENSLDFAAALCAAGVPFELHVFQSGPHGFGLGESDPTLSAWPALCAAWLKKHGF